MVLESLLVGAWCVFGMHFGACRNDVALQALSLAAVALQSSCEFFWFLSSLAFELVLHAPFFG